MQNTPRSLRTHIGLFGKVNSGKSTLLNALTGQDVAVVSPQKGTTTDPVYKPMELHGLGPVVFIDTAGFEDTSELGQKRLEKTKEATKKTDIAIIVLTDTDIKKELDWIHTFNTNHTQYIVVINDMGTTDIETITEALKEEQIIPLVVNAKEKQGVEKVKEKLIKLAPKDPEKTITGNLVNKQDIVLLVMPQDIQAPKGRLILPQVQTIRELLDKKCIVMGCTTENIDASIAALKEPPKLIICDSQVFKIVYQKKPKKSKLTSFSMLFAGFKGDIDTFIAGAKAIEGLRPDAHVLIAEACTHAPLEEDIGRIKIPRLLHQKVSDKLDITVVSGTDFPADLSSYDLIIHCGSCMFNRSYVLSRIKEAKKQGIPITNYGVTIAYLQGILDFVSY